MKKSVAEDFVPFEPVSPRSPTEAGPRLKVMPKPGATADASSFAPLETPTANGGPAHLPGSHSPHPAGPSSAGPSVSLQRDGDRITSIRIECTCGQLIELSCSY